MATDLLPGTILKVIPALAAVAAAVWAIYLFNKQQRFKRLQNLSGLWKEFFKSDELLQLFNLMNEIESDAASAAQLEAISTTSKLRYLALIEEVALYVNQFEVDRAFASYLFQWHFHFVYGSVKTSNAFWQNLGGDAERQAPYWNMSRQLSASIRPAV